MGISPLSEMHGIKPQKPCSEKLMLRISPKIHAKVVMTVDASGKSINAYVADVLQVAQESSRAIVIYSQHFLIKSSDTDGSFRKKLSQVFFRCEMTRSRTRMPTMTLFT